MITRHSKKVNIIDQLKRAFGPRDKEILDFIWSNLGLFKVL